MEKKIIYLVILMVLAFILFKFVDNLNRSGLAGFDPVSLLLAIIAAHLITVRLIDKDKK